MSFSNRLSFLSVLTAALAGCAPEAVTEDEVVPIYESPCVAFDASADACNMPPDENGSYLAAWSSLSCMDVCAALDESEPHPVIACGPIHPSDGFAVVTCTFDAETYQ